MGCSLPRGRAISRVVLSAQVVPMLPVELGRVELRKVDLAHRRATPPVDGRAATHPALDRRGRAMCPVHNSLRARGRSRHGVGQDLRPAGRVPAPERLAMRPVRNNLQVGRAMCLVHNNIRVRVDRAPVVRSAGNRAADRKRDADLVHSKPVVPKRDTDRAADPVRSRWVDRKRAADQVRSKPVDPEPGKMPVRPALGRPADRAL
ncbi:hypothetical protein ACTWPB_09100 [Nocardia sp. IBHARD005]|uniref:hypothetical protein n=1 Tax=Nocardia sp. IBHARD005 TaxID=3457765 RepID=UPI004058B547